MLSLEEQRKENKKNSTKKWKDNNPESYKIATCTASKAYYDINKDVINAKRRQKRLDKKTQSLDLISLNLPTGCPLPDIKLNHKAYANNI